MENKIYKLIDYKSLLIEKGLVVSENISHNILSNSVNMVSCDSRNVEGGALFICKGVHFKTEFLEKAMNKGAICYISEKKYDELDVPYIIVNDIRKAMAYIAKLYYNNIFGNIKIVGITGTKGKSTTTYFTKRVLDDYLASIGKGRSAVASSIDTYDGVLDFESHLTTPETFDLYNHFNNAVNSNIDYFTMEVSSQALKYDRTFGVEFDIGCYLNIGIDHISDIEHSDFEDYFTSKLRLFEQCEIAVINMDDEYSERVFEVAKKNAQKIVTFGTKGNCDVLGYDIFVSEDGISFKAKGYDFDEEFSICLHGLFNVQNALATISMCHSLGIPMEFIKSGLSKAQVSGRMEFFKNKDRNISAIVDYAHNKLSFEALFTSMMEEYPGQKISIVFGSAGGKAFGRRKELAEVAAKYAHISYITEEDPGEEPLESVSGDIGRYIQQFGGKYEIIDDREDAIKTAIENASDGEIILITGKGRETRQKRGIEYIDTPSDVDYVEKYLYRK